MKKTVSAALAAILALSLLSGCTGAGAGEPAKQVDLSEFAQALQEKYEFAAYLGEMDPENEFDKETFELTMPGLLDLELEQRINLVGMISLNNGEIGLVQAKNAGDAAKVKDIFQARIDYMAGGGETPGGAFYPGPTMLWTNNARVEVNGNYVLLVCADSCDEIVGEFNALFE